MTTTLDKTRAKVIALRDRAKHANANEHEAATALAMALKLCEKHGIDPAILDEAPVTNRVRDVITKQPGPARRYPCRFGCGVYVQHTIEELNACAEKARNANGGNAYAGQTKARDPWDDINDFFRDASRGSSHHNPNAGRARSTGSHAYCDHEATKSARAKCRRERGY